MGVGASENKTGMNPKTNALLHAQFVFSCSFPCFYREPFFPNFKGNDDMPDKVSIVLLTRRSHLSVARVYCNITANHLSSE